MEKKEPPQYLGKIVLGKGKRIYKGMEGRLCRMNSESARKARVKEESGGAGVREAEGAL